MSSIACEEAEQQYASNILNPNDIIMEVAACNMYKINMEKYIDINVSFEKKDRDRLENITKLIQRRDISNFSLIIDKVRVLKNARFFKKVPENILVNLATSAKIVEINKGKNLEIKHNDQKLLVLISGDFKLIGNNKAEIQLTSHEVIGEIIPEMWFQQRSELIAKENTKLLQIDINILYSLMTDHPDISLQIINSYYKTR
ncbi:MAG: cyclic nucleotide-binding domain-containing protein [Bacteroidales bacterium]|nr:cyclic nucleotide-binding domain-containing protein [Bacteroidales bacterium]